MPAVSGPDIFYVERIVRWRIRRGRAGFGVKWGGYDNSHNAWEPHCNLTRYGAGTKALFRDFVRKADDEHQRRLVPRK